MGAVVSRLLPPPPSTLPEAALVEIFVRLPPHPEFLRRVSFASKEIREVVTSRPFLRWFRAKHGDAPPLVGFFRNQTPRFLPTGGRAGVRSDSDRAVAGDGAGALQQSDEAWLILGTRHGRVLLQSPDRLRLLVVDPMAGRRQYIDTPLWHRARYPSTAAVVCAPGDAGHGDCRSNPFRIVFVSYTHAFQTAISIYSSATSQWTRAEIGEEAPATPINTMRPSFLIGDILYWPAIFNSILGFNLETHELREIPVPVNMHGEDPYAPLNITVMAHTESSLRLVYIRWYRLRVWVSDLVTGVHVEWAPLLDLTLDSLPSLRILTNLEVSAMVDRPPVQTVGHDEDENVLYLWTNAGVFAFQIDTMQLNRVLDNCGGMPRMLYPYRSFFLPADGKKSGSDGGGHGVNNQTQHFWNSWYNIF